MIKVYRQSRRAIYMEFDEGGNDDLIKMFSQIRDDKEFILYVEFDIAVLNLRKKQSQAQEITVQKDNNVDGSVILFQEGRIVWKMDNDYVDMGLERFYECKRQGVFFPAEFIYIQVPQNKDLDCMYCDIIGGN